MRQRMIQRKKAASTLFIGSEAVLGMPMCSMRTAARAWAHGEQQRLRTENSTCTQAKMFFKSPDLAVKRYPLTLKRQDMHYLVGLVTGNVCLNRHLKLISVKDSSICPLCSQEEETALHFLGQCSALATTRQCILGMHPLTVDEPDKVKLLNLIRFAYSSWRFTTPQGALGMHIGPKWGLSTGRGPPRRKGER